MSPAHKPTPELILSPGQQLRTEVSRVTCVVEQFLGQGLQGQVYRVELAGKPMAVKWYRPTYLAKDRYLKIRLRNAINHGPPNASFLWPQELVRATGLEGFGYLMNLRGAEYAPLQKVLQQGQANFQVLTTAGLQLADNFRALHAKGLCYVDINWGGVFLKPDTGDILICDNDNASETGADYVPLLGTIDFGAPEFWRHEAAPSRETDLYSLAVLFFQMFMLHHPMHGRQEQNYTPLDAKAKEALFVYRPIFIFDPENDTNRPVAADPADRFYDTVVERWSIYPQFFRDRFIQAFTIGLWDPARRVAESIWCSTMVQLQDSIFRCPHCQQENFFDSLDLGEEGYRRLCWRQSCKQALPLPQRLQVGKKLVVLTEGKRLFPHHLQVGKSLDFSLPLATVTFSTERQALGLSNKSANGWQITTPEGKNLEIPPGRGFGPLKPGTKISFGETKGEILV